MPTTPDNSDAVNLSTADLFQAEIARLTALTESLRREVREQRREIAGLLPHLPLPYAYAVQWGLIFDAALADRLAEVQAANPSQHYARPTLLTNGSYLLCGDLLSEVGPGGLYAAGFAQLDAERFDEIAVMPWDEAVELIPAPPVPEGL